jgi:hypothetical protein
MDIFSIKHSRDSPTGKFYHKSSPLYNNSIVHVNNYDIIHGLIVLLMAFVSGAKTTIGEAVVPFLFCNLPA